LAGHAYSIQSAFTIQENETGQEIKLVRIRNPWGSKKPKEWGGRWSDNSSEMLYNWETINKRIQELDGKEAELIHIDELNDGNFFMCYEDFVKFFSKLSICIKFPKEYEGVRFFGEWNSVNAGGTPYRERPAQIESWSKNVQYYISVSQKTHVFVSLGQKDGRLRASGTEVYPFASCIYPVILLVFKVKGQQKIPYSRSQMVADTPLKQFRESSLNTVLEAGEYVIVPSTKEPGQEGKYFLSIYHSGGKGTIIKNLDTGESPLIIAEESEVQEQMDVELKKFLKSMITEHEFARLKS
jgi:Calpain family cysteine protease/Calpain large subunit, domain III